MSKPDQKETGYILITTAIVVRATKSEETGFSEAEPFGDKMREAIVEAFRNSPGVEYPTVLDFAWLDESTMNVGRCARCGCWVSDYTQAETLQGIAGGRLLNEQWVCDECEHLRSS